MRDSLADPDAVRLKGSSQYVRNWQTAEYLGRYEQEHGGFNQDERRAAADIWADAERLADAPADGDQAPWHGRVASSGRHPRDGR